MHILVANDSFTKCPSVMFKNYKCEKQNTILTILYSK